MLIFTSCDVLCKIISFMSGNDDDDDVDNVQFVDIKKQKFAF
jgi:hypothetical protein